MVHSCGWNYLLAILPLKHLWCLGQVSGGTELEWVYIYIYSHTNAWHTIHIVDICVSMLRCKWNAHMAPLPMSNKTWKIVRTSECADDESHGSLKHSSCIIVPLNRIRPTSWCQDFISSHSSWLGLRLVSWVGLCLSNGGDLGKGREGHGERRPPWRAGARWLGMKKTGKSGGRWKIWRERCKRWRDGIFSKDADVPIITAQAVRTPPQKRRLWCLFRPWWSAAQMLLILPHQVTGVSWSEMSGAKLFCSFQWTDAKFHDVFPWKVGRKHPKSCTFSQYGPKVMCRFVTVLPWWTGREILLRSWQLPPIWVLDGCLFCHEFHCFHLSLCIRYISLCIYIYIHVYLDVCTHSYVYIHISYHYLIIYISMECVCVYIYIYTSHYVCTFYHNYIWLSIIIYSITIHI